jgi:hypothetical protein
MKYICSKQQTFLFCLKPAPKELLLLQRKTKYFDFQVEFQDWYKYIVRVNRIEGYWFAPLSCF